MTAPTVRLVGRDRELLALQSRLEQVKAGGHQIVLIAGEPGVGKSRIMQALAERAAGCTVLRGAAWDEAADIPYLPFLEAIGGHMRGADAEALRRQVGDLGPVLAVLFPELAARLGPLPPSYPLPAEQARLRLFEAVARLLSAAAAPGPLLLLLDDLHAADSASLELLAHLARQLGAPDQTARVLIVGAYRAGELARPAAFERALVEINRQRRLAHLTLAPLAADAIGALATAQLGAPLDRRGVDVLYAASEGNPFFAEELIAGWSAAGALERDNSGWTVRAPAEPTPPAIVLAVRQRLSRLPPEVDALLRTAAVIGGQFDAAVLAAVAEQTSEIVEERLLVASRAQVLRDLTAGLWGFSHAIIGQCLAQQVGASRTRQIHLRAGQALEARLDPADPRQLAAVAYHYGHSPDRTRAVAYALRAAEHALAVSAFDLALAQFRSARDLLGSADPRRGEALAGLGQAAILAGAEQEGLDALAGAEAWYVERGEPDAAARAALLLGQAQMRAEAHADAIASLERAVALPGGALHPTRVRALIDMSALRILSLHQYQEGLVTSTQALELARQLEDGSLIAAAGRAYGTLLVRSNLLPEGVALLEQALAHACAADDPSEAAECCASLTMAYTWLGRLTPALHYAQERMAHARRCRDPFQLRHTALLLAVLHGMQGRFQESALHIAQAEAQIAGLSSPEPAAFLSFVRGMLAFSQGDEGGAEALLTDAVRQFRAIGPGALVWYLGALAVTLGARNKHGEADAAAAELEQLLAAIPPGTMSMAEPLAYLAATALSLDDEQRLARYQPLLVSFHGQYHDFLIDRLLGEIALRQGDLDAAERLLAAAEAQAREGGIPAELGYTLAAQARLEQARGGRRSAGRRAALLAEARAVFAQLGNDAARRRLGAGASRAQAARAAPLPAGLTAREADVLRMVVQGKSNRAIAEALVLSEKTIANHIANIFAKTGSGNRAAAAAFAIRHGVA